MRSGQASPHFFFAGHARDDDELLDPSALLEELGRWCAEFGLIRPLPSTTPLHRARFQKAGVCLRTPEDLGPPPEACATMSNRMSPPGIVMFYVSDSQEAALREIARSSGTYALSEFKSRRELKILDLAEVPHMPSIFEEIPDTLEYDPRPLLAFVNYFVDDLSKPIERDDRVHVEYIPTQLVTEYFRTVFVHDGLQIDGIRYPSAQHEGHWSLVLFATQDDVVDGQRSPAAFSRPDPWIELKQAEERNIAAVELAQWIEGSGHRIGAMFL